MIGLDTNILVRYFAQDDAKQSALANRVIATLSKAEPGFIALVTLCELVWVLESAYALKTPAIASVLRQVLESDELVIENKTVAWAALGELTHAGVDFSDAIIAELGKQAGCRHTVTFDKRAGRMAAFMVLA